VTDVRVRIASLLPSSTEIVCAIGAGDRLVGVTHECDFPATVRALPALTSSLLPGDAVTPGEIDRHVRANVHAGSSLYALDEKLLATLEPGLIITQELCAVCAVSYEIVAQAARRLRGDPRVVSLEPSSLEDVYANIAWIGELVGAEAGAHALLARLRAREAALRERVAGRVRPGTVVLEWTDPPMSGGHWTPGLVELAGGAPLLAHPGVNSQVLTWEAIAAADPDVVIVAPCGYDLPHALAAARALDGNPAWRALRAVRSGRAYAMDGNAYVNRPGPRLIDTAEIFADAIAGTAGPSVALSGLERSR
jgi:iron complex transport system substrate-binding protein